jgi:cytochrome c oxidase subunit I+III
VSADRSPSADLGPAGRSLTPTAAERRPDELRRLEEVWQSPRGWRALTDVNNTRIGLLYIGTAVLFLVLGGMLALVMRAQLAMPQNTLVGPETYNQLFTMHGSVMMFLFAVPVVEAMGVYLLPGMLGARDLPFPRLNAYAYWAYAIGGLVFFGSVFFGRAPDGGWFMYPPLTNDRFSPGVGADFWLLGIGFIEISAIAGAIELIVGVLRTRAPGMSLLRMPMFAWAMLVVGGMVVFAFPAVILCTLLLELERAFGWPFFISEQGGSPLLWQHLFWFFGHPDVYIIFLPAAGMVSMIIATMAQTPLVGYRLVVAGVVGMGALSFALWAHHMFAAGISVHALHFFSLASFVVVIPSGIQVFAWLATIRRGRVRLHTPMLFILGFFVVFTIGGLTGVMLAVVPFDWQAHDSHFVVAHLHYVILGGMLFPLLAGFYYWAPTVGGRPLSERVGRWVCGLLFAGVNVTFLPMHLTGLYGMPRRVYTYAPGLGWDALNLVSSAGSVLIAAGIGLLLFDVARHLRPADRVDVNPWNAGTLEWLALGNYGSRSIPLVTSREPLWDQPGLRGEVDRGEHYLPGTVTGLRETIVTSPVAARPQYVAILTGPSWAPVLAAVGTAAFFLLLTVKLVIPAIAGGVLAVAMLVRWAWDTDRGPLGGPVEVARGVRLPVYVTGPRSHAWWAMIVLMAVLASIFASLVFSYAYLALVNPGRWPRGDAMLPSLVWPGAAAIAAVAGGAAMAIASRVIASSGALSALTAAAVGLLMASVALDLVGQVRAGLAPHRHAYDATVAAFITVQASVVAAASAMGVYTLARAWRGLVDTQRRVTFDNTRLLVYYAIAQGLVALAIVHAVPRLVG